MSKFLIYIIVSLLFILPAQAYESTILKGDYVPTKEDIQTAEKIMKEAVKTNKRIKDIGYYTRQYQGTLNKKGEKIIWINCFCSADPNKDFPHWRKEQVFVLDGGACFFNIMINLETGDYYNFFVNGDA